MKTKFIRLIMKQINRWQRCGYCNESMAEAINAYNRNEPFTLMFNPARNSSGNVTGWHICKLDQEKVKTII